MKPVTSLFALFLASVPLPSFGGDPASSPSDSSSMEGSWVGRLSEQLGSLKLVLHIKNDGSRLVATMDSPDQNGYGIPVSHISREGNKLSFQIEKLTVEFQGTLDPKKKEIHGTFRQYGMSCDLGFRSLAAMLDQLPSELGFQYAEKLPKDLLPSPGEGSCRIRLFNKTTDYLCLALVDGDGNLRHGWAEGKANTTVFYVSPESQTALDRPYLVAVGTPFVILSLAGRILGYGQPSKAGDYDLKLE